MLKTEEIFGKKIAEMNKENLEKLKERVGFDKVNWVLGAGISKSAGVPLWGECLLRMWARTLFLERNFDSDPSIGKEFRSTLEEIKKEMKHPEIFLEKINQTIIGTSSNQILTGVSTLEAAEYIQNFVAETISWGNHGKEYLQDLAFAGLVKDSLKIDKTPDEIWEKMKDQVLGVLAAYFMGQIKKNREVTVISYNFDDLLEFALERVGLEQEKCHIKNPGTKNVLEGKKGVHIYHPHGTVSVIPNSLSEESQKLVLAESNYERLEQKAYLWENSIQAKVLHDKSCVFLGFSGEDYNFRRIIKNMERDGERQDIKHYLFLSIQSFVKKMFHDVVNKKLLRDTARTQKEREEFLSHIEKKEYDNTLREILHDESMIYERMLIVKKLYAQYLYWERYNIIPIWTTREELPQMVQEILS